MSDESATVHAHTLAGPLVENVGVPEHNTRLFGRLDFELTPKHTLTISYKFKNKSKSNQEVGEFNLSERANGRAEFERTFKVVFDQIRSGKTGAPYMDIQPRGVKIQLFGNIAIATFHLDDRAGFLNRRTIVLNKTKARWKIVHLHASEVGITCAQP